MKKTIKKVVGMHKKILVGSIIVLFSLSTISYGAGPVAIVTDSKGSEIPLTSITSMGFAIQIGDSSIFVPFEQVIRIDQVEPGKLWKVTSVDGLVVKGEISVILTGEWVLGKYEIEMSKIQGLVFPGKKLSNVGSKRGLARAIDSKGISIDLTEIWTSSFNLSIGGIEANLNLERIASIIQVDKAASRWRISPLEGPSLEGRISGELRGKWALGDYTINLENLSQLSFPGRTPAGVWPEKPTIPWVAQLTLAGNIDLRVSEMSVSPSSGYFDASYSSFEEAGVVQYIDKSPFLALSNGGAVLLIDLRMVKKVAPKGEEIKVFLKNGTEYAGRLSNEYSFHVTTSWGFVTFSHSMIEGAIIEPERIMIGIDDTKKKELDLMFSKAVFPGLIEVEGGKTISVTALVMEYVNLYSGCSRFWIPCKSYSGSSFFAAIQGIPFYLGDSFLELEPSKIEKMAVVGKANGTSKIRVTAIGGTVVEGMFAAGGDIEQLKRYTKDDRNNYHLIGILGRSDFGYIRIPVSAIKEIRRVESGLSPN